MWGSLLSGIGTIGAGALAMGTVAMLGYGVYKFAFDNDKCDCSKYLKLTEQTKVALRKCEMTNTKFRENSRTIPNQPPATTSGGGTSQHASDSHSAGSETSVPDFHDLGNSDGGGGDGATQ